MKTSSFNYPELVEILQAKTPCALATVLGTHGSTPQKAGSSALIGFNQLLAGTVGGGMTELKVIQQSQVILNSKTSGIFSFDLSGDLTKGSDSICGGGMTILLDAAPEMHLPVFQQLKKSLEDRIPGVLITWLDETNPEEILISRYWFSKTNQPQLPVELKNAIEPVISDLLEHTVGNSIRLISVNEGENKGSVFLESVIPKPSLVIAGAGHIGQSLAHFGKILGFEVTVWDDRTEFANKSQLTDADFILTGSSDSFHEQINIQADSYLVIVTRGHKSDAEVLRKFITTEAAYIGMIGSKSKVNQMRKSFIDNKWASQEQWNRIYTPIGMDIGALTVEEIAVSIAAQLVQVRNKRNKTGE